MYKMGSVQYLHFISSTQPLLLALCDITNNLVSAATSQVFEAALSDRLCALVPFQTCGRINKASVLTEGCLFDNGRLYIFYMIYEYNNMNIIKYIVLYMCLFES